MTVLSIPAYWVWVVLNKRTKYFAVSRQMVLFAVERRKAWRMLQSKAGVVNKDYLAQKALLVKLDKGEIQLAEVQSKTKELFESELARFCKGFCVSDFLVLLLL